MDSASVSDLENRITMAVGSLVRQSALAVIFLEQVGTAVSGVDSFFEAENLVEGTMRPQVNAVRAAVERHRSSVPNDLYHDALSAIDALGVITAYRNRVVHDDWTAQPTDKEPDKIQVARCTRYSHNFATVTTDLKTLNVLQSLIGAICDALSGSERAIAAHRSGKDRIQCAQLRDDPYRHNDDAARRLRELMSLFQSNRLPHWRWT